MSNSRRWRRILLRQSGRLCDRAFPFVTGVPTGDLHWPACREHGFRRAVRSGERWAREPVLLRVPHRTLERRRLHLVSVPFDFDEVFDADYLFFYEPLFADVTEADVDVIWRLLKLEPDMAVLDLACGHGRIANRLAERGARVTGLDSNALFLDHARRDAASRDIQVDYVEGDMRLLPSTNERFDRVLSWFTSFGYFDDQDNRRVLHEAHRVLRP